MKSFNFSVVTVLAMSTFAMAGGDIAPVEEPIVVVEPVMDESAFYVGLGYSSIDMEATLHTDDGYQAGRFIDDKANGVLLLAGYEFTKNLAVEARYTKALSDFKLERHDDSSNFFDVSYYNVALYLKPQVNFNSVTLYGLLGYGVSGFECSDIDVDTTESDFQYGVGLSYQATENLSVFVDYTVLYDEDNTEVLNHNNRIVSSEMKVNSLNAGITYKF